MIEKKRGINVDFTIQIKDIILIVTIIVSLLVGYTKFESVIEYHIKDQTAHLTVNERANITKMEITIQNLTKEVNRLNDILEKINRNRDF